MMKVFIKTNLLGLFLFCSYLSSSAQQRVPMPARQSSEFANTHPEYCWRTEQMLWNISASTPTDETIIVIARLGAKESRSNLNRRRLHNVQIYWTQNSDRNAKRKAETIILAEAERTNGKYGQLEFYVGGKLVEIVKVSPNRDLIIGNCYAGIEGEPPFCAGEIQKLSYPCKDRNRKQKQKRKVTLKKNRLR
jgi:hypothetical protein